MLVYGVNDDQCYAKEIAPEILLNVNEGGPAFCPFKADVWQVGMHLLYLCAVSCSINWSGIRALRCTLTQHTDRTTPARRACTT